MTEPLPTMRPWMIVLVTVLIALAAIIQKDGAMMDKTWPLVICILGTALSSAALILLIPSLFRSDHGGTLWVAVLMGCIAVVFASGSLYWKSHFSVGDDDR